MATGDLTAQKRATDWNFLEVASIEEGAGLAAGIKIFHFHSPTARVAGVVSFMGAGRGVAESFKVSQKGAAVILELLSQTRAAKVGPVSVPLRPPYATKELSRHFIPFSLDDLHSANGTVLSVGGGVIFGGGLTQAIAVKDGRQLFECARIALDIGRFGVGATELKGKWSLWASWQL